MKTKALLFTCLALLMLHAFESCVSPLEIDSRERRSVVISGVLTNSRPEREILIYRSVTQPDSVEVEFSGVRDRREPIEATGVVYRNGEIWTDLIPIEPGRHLLPDGFELEPGNEYYVEFATASGEVYRSAPSQVPEPLETDSMSFRLDIRPDGFNSRGQPIEVRLIDVFAHINLPEPEAPTRYYRWQVDQVWAFLETPKPSAQRGGEPDVIQTCYLRRSVEENPSTLLSSEDLPQGPLAVGVHTQEIDESFLRRHYVNAYLHAISEDAFRYYSQAERLQATDGQLYDEVPAALVGNVFNPNDSNELVLGYVDFCLTDTARLKLIEGAIGTSIYDGCRPGDGTGGCRIPVRAPNDTTPYYCRCWDCDQIYGFETLIPPPYWE